MSRRKYADPDLAARALARDITAKRAALNLEEERRREARQQGLRGRSLPGRGSGHVSADRNVTDGMVLGLSYLLGCPGERWTAEDFIRGTGQDHGTQDD